MARSEHITSTGWRIVGNYDHTSFVPEVEAGRDEDVLFIAKFAVRARLGTRNPLPSVLEILHDAVRAHWDEAPPFTVSENVVRSPQKFHGLRWEPRGTLESFSGTLLWRHPHPETGGAPCTTHVIVSHNSGHCHLAVRVTADNGLSSVRGMVGAGLARPAWLSVLNGKHRLIADGLECRAHFLEVDSIPAFVSHTLLSDSRRVPIVVISQAEDGSYPVEAATLGDEFIGLAHVCVLDSQRTSFALTDEVGDRRLSCYWGALRVYMPGFSCADRPDQHPLLQVDEVVDPLARAHLVGNLSRFAMRRITDFAAPEVAPLAPLNDAPVTPARLRSDNTPPSADAPSHATTQVAPSDHSSVVVENQTDTVGQEAAIAAPAAAPLAPELLSSLLTTLGNLDSRLALMTEAMSRFADTNTLLLEEISRLRSTTLARSSGSNLVDRRLQSMEAALKSLVHSVASSSSATPSPPIVEEPIADDEAVRLVDVVKQATAQHADTLLFLESAEITASASPYEDHERLAAMFDIMAEVAKRRRSGSLGGSLREVFREFGVDYRGGIAPSTSERLRQQYVFAGPDATEYECHEHLVLGSGYDPRYCLRIYFTSRAPMESRFVIGHVGRHLDVKSTT